MITIYQKSRNIFLVLWVLEDIQFSARLPRFIDINIRKWEVISLARLINYKKTNDKNKKTKRQKNNRTKDKNTKLIY